LGLNVHVLGVLADFLASSAPVFLAHIAASDGLLHVDKMETAEPLLTEFENALSGIYFKSRGDLGVIVFSDHGNTQTPSRAVPLESFLGQSGWNIRESVRGPRDVAIPSDGLVAFAAIYCRPEAIDTIAEDLRGIEGADVIVSRHPDRGVDRAAALKATIRAAASNATAELAWSTDGRRYRNDARDGDPLGLLPVFESLRFVGRLDADGFVSDADLFAATSLASFPRSSGPHSRLDNESYRAARRVGKIGIAWLCHGYLSARAGHAFERPNSRQIASAPRKY
jgi:hypothetical protein